MRYSKEFVYFFKQRATQYLEMILDMAYEQGDYETQNKIIHLVKEIDALCLQKD